MGEIKLSQRALQTPPSPIRRLAHLASQARRAGTKVYHLNIGQPDIESPPEFYEGVRRFSDKVLAYEASSGNDRLREAWSAYMNKTLGLATSSSDFLITTGASEALIFLFMTCCDPGDEFIIFDPTYANYIGFAAIAGVKLVQVDCAMKDNFALPDKSAIESKITERTRGILLCSPNNPTGTIYSKEEISMLLEICDRRNIFFIADETYREFVYDDHTPLSVLHLAPRNDRVIVVDSLSKRFSLCGARIGCLLTSNKQVLATTLNLAQARLASPTLDQWAAAYMLENISLDFVEQIKRKYERRRNVLFDSLATVKGAIAHKPGGAFYAVVQLPVENAEHFASYLLSEFSLNGATTFVAPASGFYMQNGRGLSKVRIAYVLNESDIESAVDVIKAGLDSYYTAVPARRSA
ncbi:MAG: pyridoxal phosphate-dependent aminotransferase [Deltaproteobacteria bacterium]|nr:pyridoxal phosphate-dependent aminotransferase [Deltaproteobacteria bacterium]